MRGETMKNKLQKNRYSTTFGVDPKIAIPQHLGLTPLFPRFRAKKYTKKAASKETAFLNGGQTRNRTRDTRIFSPPLYQLSYLAKY